MMNQIMKKNLKTIGTPPIDKSPAKLKRLKALNTRVRGTFKDFMTQEDLKIMREDAK